MTDKKNKPGRRSESIQRTPGNFNHRENSTDANLDREDQNAEIIEHLETEESLRLSSKVKRDDNTNRRQQKKYPDRRDDNR